MMGQSSQNNKALVVKSGLLNRPLVDPNQGDLTMRERWLLDFFWKAGSFQSALYIHDEFWGSIVHQISALQPSVRHACIALSAAQKQGQLLSSGQMVNEEAKMTSFIMRQTSLSLANLLELPKDSASKRVQREVVLSACTILTGTALFRRELSTVRTHLLYGLKVVDEWKATSADFDSDPVGPALYQALTRLEIKYKAFCKPEMFLQDDNPLALHAPALTLESFNRTVVRRSLDLLWEYWSWSVMQPLTDGFSIGTVDGSCDWLASELCVISKVFALERQLRIFVHGRSVTQSIRDMWTSLWLWQQVLRVRLGTSAALSVDLASIPFEMRFDAFWKNFQAANEAARELLWAQLRRTVSNPSFSVDMVVITPLLFCGFHCREWTIRRDTLGLLKAWEEACPSRPVHVKVSTLQWLVDFESEGLQPGEVVPESARIHFVRVKAHPGSKVHLTYLRSGVVGFDEFD